MAHHVQVPGGTVITQWQIGGKHHDLIGFVRGHAPGGDPDKVLVDILVPPALADENSDAENLLHTPVTFGRVLQHGDKHATFRYVGE